MLDELDRSSLFHDLSVSQLKEILPFCTLVQLNDGDILIHEGDSGNRDLYLLCMGSVEIVSNNTAIISNEVVLSKEDTELLGEVSWLTGRRRTASVRCRGHVEAIQIDGQALWEHMESHTDIGFLVMKRIALTLSERIDVTDALMKQILWNMVI